MKIRFYTSSADYELDELELINDEKYLQSKFSSDFYYVIKALELNERFNKVIAKARKQCGMIKDS